MKHLWGVAALVTLGLAACSPQAGSPAAQAEAPAAPVNYEVATVAEGLAFPWSIAFLPDGTQLVTEREGQLRAIRNGRLDPAPIKGLPDDILVENQGGLFEVSPHPNFAENRYLYISYAAGTRQENATRLIRGRFDGATLSEVETLFEARPKKAGGAHFGGRILWLPDGTLMLSLGDGYEYLQQAQSLDAHFGKIVRLTDTGSPPSDNPFIGKGLSDVWSYGHRNVQGLVRDPATGAVYAHEHGPKGGDEVNLIQPGRNYGWPAITYGVDYSGATISPFTEREGMEQPLVYWVPSIAPSGMEFYSGEMFPQWRGDLLVSALTGQQVRRVNLEAGKVVGQETLFSELNVRLRDVAQAPDGSIYLLTDEPEGKVLRVSRAQGG